MVPKTLNKAVRVATRKQFLSRNTPIATNKTILIHIVRSGQNAGVGDWGGGGGIGEGEVDDLIFHPKEWELV